MKISKNMFLLLQNESKIKKSNKSKTKEQKEYLKDNIEFKEAYNAIKMKSDDFSWWI